MVNEFENTLFLAPDPEKAFKPEPATVVETVEVSAEGHEAVESPDSSETLEVVVALELPVFPTLTAEEVTDLIFFAPPLPPIAERQGRSRNERFDRYDSQDGSNARHDRNERNGRAERDEDSEESSSSRRRSRSRGERAEGSQRTPREPELITEPQRIKGSTRLEAKKQRRRDGRDAGRRRTVVTESEFLARREAVDRTMVVRDKDGRIQIGVLEDNVLVEHYVARSSEASLIGNVYLGKVQNVLPSMEAAFVDIGRGRNAVLYSGEVDWDSVETGNQPRRIELALKPGDKVLVQVTKDPVGQKGARLTSQVSLPGRYLVVVPNGSMNGISRKLPENERARLKKILKEVLPEGVGVIVRTAAEGATEEQLTIDVNRLTSQWASIQEKVESGAAPAVLHSEPDLLIKIVRDVFNEDFQKMVIDGDEARETITSYLAQVAPELLERIHAHTGDRDAFAEYRVTEQIEKALDRKVWLPSGGSLVIDRTEAMTVVDVNTGKFVGSGGNLEETVTKNNLEAAEEVVRQLRLRDIGGIIVVDFIDMVLESNHDLVHRRLIECLSRDRTKHQVAEVTSLGLVQMTRKKVGLGLLETFSEACEVCAGRGVVVFHEPVTRKSSGNNVPANSGEKSNNRRKGRNASTPIVEPHGIPEGAASALAKIAASTIGHHADEHTHEDHTATDIDHDEKHVELDAQFDANDAVHSHEGRSEDEPVDLERLEIVEILDIPVKARRTSRRVSTQDTENLLEGVLGALPEPKSPGQGRGRGRSV